MNNKTWILTRAMLKNGGGLGLNLKSKWSWVLLLLILFVSLPIMLYGYVEITAFFYNSLAAIGQEGVLLSWGLVISAMMVFVFGVFHVVSNFYFANDIENYLPMPVRPRQIVGAKFLQILLYEYIAVGFSFLPMLVYFGVRQGVSALYYLYGLAVLIFLPILPLALASLLVMLIMRMVNLTRYRELLRIIGGSLAVFLALGFSFVMQRFNELTPEELGELLQSGSNSLALMETKLFPTVRWAVQALLRYEIAAGLTNLLVFIGLSVLVFAALLLISELVYIKGVIGISESGSRRHKIREGEFGRLVKRRTALTACLSNEIKLLVRTPIYFINCVLPGFIWPVFFTVSFIFASDRSSTVMLEQLSGALNDPNTMGKALGIILALVAFLGGANGIAATAISREGQQLYIKRYIPVSYRKQLAAKLLSGVVIGYTSVILVLVVLTAVLKAPLYFAGIVLILSFLPLLLTSMGGLLFDLINPKLEWDSEQKAVKQNVNVFFSILFSVVIAIAVIAVSFAFDLSLAWALVVLPALLLAGCACFYYLLSTYGVSTFKNLEG